MKKLFFCAALFLNIFPQPLTAMENAPPITETIPWHPGEKLIYDIKWGIVPAGEATLEVAETAQVPTTTFNPNQNQAYHFVATAHSNSFVDVFYKVRDRNESWLDKNQWLTHRFEQHNQEGPYILDQIVEYNWPGQRYKNTENVKGREPKVNDGPLEIAAVDTLSSLYFARAKPLEVGSEFTMEVHSGRNWPLVVKVLKREKIKVTAGEFDCFILEPYLRERGLFVQKGKKLRVWLTADERRIPVLMKAEIFIGHITAELKAINNKP